MRLMSNRVTWKSCASVVAVAGAVLLTSCSTAPTTAPFDPGAAPAATARAEATAVAAAQQTQIAAPAATAAYQAERDSLTNRELALRLSEQEHVLLLRQQQDAIDLERQRALIPPMATQASASAQTEVVLSQAAGALPLIGGAVLVIVITGGVVWLFYLERREREKTRGESERTGQERARRIEIEARALAPREPVPGLLQIYNVQMGIWTTQPRPPTPAWAEQPASQPAIAAAPDHARRTQWHRALYSFARQIDRRQRQGDSTSRRAMKVDGICEEGDWNTLTDALACVGALDKRQGAAARLVNGATPLLIRDQFQTGYWSLPADIYAGEPPRVGAIVNASGIVDVEAEPVMSD